MQYNLCIMDTLRLFISVLTIRVYLIIQVSLQVHAKAHLGSITKWFYILLPTLHTLTRPAFTGSFFLFTIVPFSGLDRIIN